MAALNSIAVLGAIIFAHAGSLTDGVIGRGLLGLGMAANLMGTLKLFTKWFDLGKFATITGLLLSMGALGTLAATSPFALLVQALGWRGAFYALAFLNAFLTMCLWILVRDTPLDKRLPNKIPSDTPSPPSAWGSMKALFTTWNYWAISLSIFLRYGSFASIQALWAGPFLMVHLGLSAVTAGNLLLMISAGFILGSPLGGILSDRVLHSRKRALIFALFIQAAAIFTLAQWQGTSHLVALAAALFLMGFFASGGGSLHPCFGCRYAEHGPQSIRRRRGLSHRLSDLLWGHTHGLGVLLHHQGLHGGEREWTRIDVGRGAGDFGY
jgi:predicted MFS family arabinose efflux permease